ncbi:unnamed protein product [Cylicocyclus nassatus]|uniref:Ground-like domain-containing protein n=1 Tax=Cylicocyclus nassatus TaxID=53992 RepID=A0AA36DKC0_CYLNA|nr:unnamed protein product [Cylicocyclus nassatus]
MWLPILIALLARHVYSSPPMCHCPGGQVGMSCPQPIQLNCPAMNCPPAPACNPFPTLPTFAPGNGIQGIQSFTLPTLAPLQGGAFGPQTTPLPLPVAPPTGGQESLLPIQDQNNYQQNQYQQVQQQGLPPPQLQAPPPQPPQGNVQDPNLFADAIPVDATTRATTLPSEKYVEMESPEYVPPASLDENSGKFDLYENQPNNGYRQPVRRAMAPSPANGKPEVFTDKCNDERLKKIIEDNIDANPSSSKRKIQKAATDQIGGLFDVICSSHDFSYLANTQLFCEAGNDDITCFAFLHSLIQKS